MAITTGFRFRAGKCTIGQFIFRPSPEPHVTILPGVTDHSPLQHEVGQSSGSSAGPPGKGTRATAGSRRLRAYYELTKPGIAGFVMVTAGAAFVVASRGNASLAPVLHTLLGTLLATAGALALNQYLEREVDAIMKRTRGRPVPSGRLQPAEALAFGAFLVVAGVGHLWFWIGWMPALLTLLSAVVYLGVYTPLKSRSYMATLAGAFPGSAPALIGWSAATGDLGVPALVLFGTMFIWQLPHVVALAWLLKEDYALAGFHLIPSNLPDGGDAWTGRQLVLYSVVLIPMSLALTPLGFTGWIYFAGALILGGIMLWWSAAALMDMTRNRVRKVFFGSLAYHPLLLTVMLLDIQR
jgi:heme o synthase